MKLQRISGISNNNSQQSNSKNMTMPRLGMNKGYETDTFSQQNINLNKQITFEAKVLKMPREVKVKKLFELYDKLKEINLNGEETLKSIKKSFAEKTIAADKKIREISEDSHFVAETLQGEKEKSAWATIADLHYQEEIFYKYTEDDASEHAIEAASNAITNGRIDKPEEFLEIAAEKLEDSNLDENFQQLKTSLKERIAIKKAIEDATLKHHQEQFDKKESLEHEIASLLSGESSNFRFRAIEERCNTDKTLNKIWQDAYKDHFKNNNISWYNNAQKRESAKLSANIKAQNYLLGQDEAAF